MMKSDRIGEQFGNYRLERLLGRGGFADVYLADHIYLHTKAAIKILQTRLTDEDNAKFLQEARTIAQLVHPHIVKVLDFGLQEDTPFLVMGYAPNGTLRSQYRKGVMLPPHIILPHVKQVASALQYAHDHRIVHRDIKPENMLLGHHSEVLLSDFGIAFVTQSSRYSNAMESVGTAGYMAPEQIQGRAVPASDQYSLGIVVYEWLSGDRPFHGTFTEIASQHLFAQPPPLRQKNPSLSPDIEQVVMVTLAKEAKARFQSIQAFANAFEQACGVDAPTYITPPASSPKFDTTRAATPPVLEVPPARPAHEQTLAATPSQPPAQQHPLVSSVYTPQAPPEQQSTSKGPSRRGFLIGAAGLGAGIGLLLIAGGVAWWEVGQRSTTASTTKTTPATGTPPTHSSSPAVNSNSTPTVPSGGTTPQPQTPTPTSTPTSTPTQPTSSIGNLLYTYRGHSGLVYADTWSPNGSRVASCGQDKTVQVWDATTGGNVVTYRGHTNEVYALSWSSQQLIASGSEDHTVQVWNASSGSRQYSYTNHTLPVYTVGWSPDGQRVASGSGDKTVQVWDGTTGGNAVAYTGHTDIVRTVGWSPDGSRLASGSEDGTVRVWNASTGSTSLIYRGHTGGVLIVAWSPDGNYIVSGGRDATVRVWNASTGQTALVYTGHSARVWSVSWSPNGQRIASGGRDNTVQLWDALTGSNAYTYRGHTDVVWSALWSPDGKYIASASNDTTVQVWVAS